MEDLLDKIPRVMQRCPKCGSLSISFDPKQKALICSKCGYKTEFKG